MIPLDHVAHAAVPSLHKVLHTELQSKKFTLDKV